MERLKTETQRRLLDIYHCDQSIATITDEAGGALYGPDKLSDLGVYPGTLLRAIPVGARPYLEVIPADDAPAASGVAGGGGAHPVSTSWALQALDKAIAEKEAFIDGINGMTLAQTMTGGQQQNGGGVAGADGAPMQAGADVLAAIDRVMAQREGVLEHLDGLAEMGQRPSVPDLSEQ